MELKSKSLKANQQGLIALDSPEVIQAALDGILSIDKKKVLVLRGGDCRQASCQIFMEFSKRKDRTGEPFGFSLKMRGVTERNIYGATVKINPGNLERYITEFFILAELLIVNAGQRVLVLVDKMPRMSCQLFLQDRFVQPHAGLFEISD